MTRSILAFLLLIGVQLVFSEFRRPGDNELKVHWRSFKLTHCKIFRILFTEK
jgi:hypothetical protein